MEKPQNPPAFPGEMEQGFGQGNDYNTGMTLLDHFAGIAFGHWVKAHIDMSVDDLTKERIAIESYNYANYMLKERERLNA